MKIPPNVKVYHRLIEFTNFDIQIFVILIIRYVFFNTLVVCAIGLRAEESPARARRETCTLRKDSSAPTKGRFVYDWLPLHDWTEADVWDCIRRHGDVYHAAYSYGNHRLSCALCVLASLNDLINGAVHNPETYCEYCHIEAVTGYNFRKGFWLSDVKPELLPQDIRDAVRRHQRAA